MKDAKIEALIKLLDDTDPEVLEAVEAELRNMGTQALSQLEEYWLECTDEQCRNRIELIIQDLNSSASTEQLKEWRLAGGNDLLEGWLAFSSFEFPNIKADKYKNAISRLVHKIWLQTSTGMRVVDKLHLISNLLFYTERFTANVEDIEEPRLNCINFVLDNRKSNTLGYSALYFYLCQKLDIPLHIVNFSGYYALRFYDGDQHFYIDPFNKGIIFSAGEVQIFLEKLKLESNLMTYKPMSNIYVILDMIQFSAMMYRKNGNEEKYNRLQKLIKDIEIHF